MRVEDRSLKTIREEISRLRDHTELVPVADLFEALLPDVEPDPGERPARDLAPAMREGTAVIEVIPLSLDQYDVLGRWRHVVECAGDPLDLPPESRERLGDLDASRVVDMVRALPADTGVTIEGLAADAGITPPAASFLAIQTASPFYRAYARAVGPAEDVLKLWGGGTCPVCSASPHYGMLVGESGARILECWLCGTGWKFPRLVCPYCKNRDQDQLGFFCLDGNEDTRIHFCRQCLSYVKILDCRELAREVALNVVCFANLIHDVAALQQGFRPGSGLRFFR